MLKASHESEPQKDIHRHEWKKQVKSCLDAPQIATAIFTKAGWKQTMAHTTMCGIPVRLSWVAGAPALAESGVIFAPVDAVELAGTAIGNVCTCANEPVPVQTLTE